MNTCDTCKHWSSPEKYHTPYGGICDHPKLSLDDEELTASDQLASWSYEGCMGSGIYVGPKFGCIHHEKKS